MKRRNLLVGIGAAAGGAAAVGSGAFSTASVDREMSVVVADDSAGVVALTPGDGPNGAYVDDSGDQIVIDFGAVADGLIADTEFTFDDLLGLQNQGTEPVFVWTAVSSDELGDDAVYLYSGEDEETPLTAGNAVEVAVGESLSLGVAVDTTGLSADTYGVTVTIEAAAEAPEESPPEDPPEDPPETIDPIVLDSVSSLLNASQEPLTDDSIVAVAAEPTATNSDADGNGDAVDYPDDVDIPVVAVDGSAVGITGPFATSDTSFGTHGNEEFLLNLYDELLGGSGTVLHDEGHGQYYTLAPNGGDDYQAFADYAESNGYTYEATQDIENDIGGADAVVVTSPSEAFTDSELSALADFAADGGAVFLHDQSDYNNFDQTANHNAIAEALSAGFRFNDDQVVDEENNTGAPFVPTTANFNAETFSLFGDRDGLGLDLDPSESYEVDVVSVADGDTADVEFQGGETDTVRILGIDTPETGNTSERLQEYEGVDDGAALKQKGDAATAYAEDQLAGETVTLSFDENEGLRGNFGRLLGFLELSDGSVYNENVVEDGFARVYDSGLAGHDAYWDLEASARGASAGLWEISDPAATPEVGDDPVEELFVPEPVAVEGGEVPVESEAGDPLVALDADANVAVVGGPLVEESFESGEGGPGTDGYGVYPFLTNVIDAVGDDPTGPVLVDGGHGQFAADFAVSAEDAAYYQRYLEGQAPDDEAFVSLEAVNELATDPGPDLLDDSGNPAARALLVSAPTAALSDAERSAVADFAAAGGAIVLLGTAADDEALGNFDPVLSDLGADVGFTTQAVTDDQNNLAGDPTVPTTANFADGFGDLFEPFTGGGAGVESLVFDSATALLAGDGQSKLTDDSVIAAASKPTATVEDADGNGDAEMPYAEDDQIPLLAVDDGASGAVLGLTAPFVDDGSYDGYDNATVLLNAFETYGGETVLWDEGHGQFYGTGEVSNFVDTAADAGYTVTGTESLTDDLGGADAAVITAPSDAFSDAELDALADFVADGGLAVLAAQSDFNDFDETANHNAIAAALSADFRFDDAQTVDDQSNAGASFQPVTDDLDAGTFPGLFEG